MSVDVLKFEVEFRRVYPGSDRWKVNVVGKIDYSEELVVEVGERTLQEQIERTDVEFGSFMDFFVKPGVVNPKEDA